MRFVKIIFTVGLCLLMSGCAMMTTDIEGYLKSPDINESQQHIRRALDAHTKQTYTLKYPNVNGERVAYVIGNFDGLPDNEAVVFYALKSEPSVVKMAYFEKNNNDWSFVSEINGPGKNIDSVQLSDYNNDGIGEIITMWDPSKSAENDFVIYRCNKDKIEALFTDSCSSYQLVDFDNNSSSEILLENIDTQFKTSGARLFEEKDGSMKMKASISLDDNITGVISGKVGYINYGQKAVFLELYKGAGIYLTEAIYYDRSGNLRASFHSMGKGTKNQTERFMNVFSTDIDGDLLVEIPMCTELPGYTTKPREERLYCVSWLKLFDDFFVASSYTFYNGKAGYRLNVPETYKTNVTVEESNNGQEWRIKQWNESSGSAGQELFRIDVLAQDSISNNSIVKNGETVSYDPGLVLAKTNGKIYYATIFQSDSPYAMTLDQVKKMFALN